MESVASDRLHVRRDRNARKTASVECRTSDARHACRDRDGAVLVIAESFSTDRRDLRRSRPGHARFAIVKRPGPDTCHGIVEGNVRKTRAVEESVAADLCAGHRHVLQTGRNVVVIRLQSVPV